MGSDDEDCALSDEQQLVLQAIYDRFREQGKWPTFISIDRPLRREHGIDTRAIFASLPDSLVVKPRQGMGPTDTDDLTLRLPGIEACQGGSEDTERFVRTLRWFAEQELAYSPLPAAKTPCPVSPPITWQRTSDCAGPTLDMTLHLSGFTLGVLGLGSLLLTQVRYEHPASIKDAEAQELATREAADMRRADSASAQLSRDGLDGLPADPAGLN